MSSKVACVGRFRDLGFPLVSLLVVSVLGTTWRFMGRHKWGYK